MSPRIWLTQLGWWLVMRFGEEDLRFAEDLEIVYTNPKANFTWNVEPVDERR